MKSLANIFRHLIHPHELDHEARPAQYRHEDSAYALLGQGTEKQHASQAPPAIPTRQEALNYLAQLAKDYHLPAKLVYAVADAESSFNSDLRSPNYARDKHHRIIHDKLGNPVVKSWDYGLMQINGPNIGKEVVKDPHGKRFTIGEDVKSDWRANARAGVAILAHAYDLAVLEQGPGATEEDHAQQAYSQYNGTGRTRERYLKQRRDGLPQDDADRNFLLKYRRW